MRQAAAQDVAVRKQARASRVADGGIRLDGRLDEGVWLTATPITDATQKAPTEGTPPTDPTELRFLFDGDALYVGARMSSASDPTIRAAGRASTV
jgi:hypothetical protein